MRRRDENRYRYDLATTTRLKFALVLALDFADDRILRHRFYKVCLYLGLHPFWGA